MSSAVAELETGLQAMLSLKPPGVTGSRIQSITALCKSNVQSESVLIQKLFTHFKKAPGTHKLGVLYVVDSVTREWMVQAKAAGQTINSSAVDGTYAAGVNRVKELLPVLMNDIIQSAPVDQKEKIKKLIDIWEKGQTFPHPMLVSFKEKLTASLQNRSTTPDGSPPPDLQARLGLQQPSANASMPPGSTAPPANTASILEALVNIARQNTSAQAASSNPVPVPQPSSFNVSTGQIGTAQQPSSLNMLPTFSQYPQPVNTQPVAPSYTPYGQYDITQQHAGISQANAYGAVAAVATPPPPPPPPQSGGLDPGTAMLIKMLAERGVAADQIAGIIAAGSAANNNTQPLPDGRGARLDDSRDPNGFHGDPVRSPPGRFRRRSRSPSPVRGWSARESPPSHRRDDEYFRGRESPAHGRKDNDYRQRSPPRRWGRSPTPPQNHGNSGTQKWIDFDPNLPRGCIKVLSRTLFVGGVNSSEQELRRAFERYGTVQTCIVNKDKRHAFVKMLTREDAVNARESMEQNRSKEPQGRARSFNQTRWGVGFGPRDCSDYTTGISVIPISKLTDADRKWMVTAEFGGTGGKAIESGMVVEEPDIEIGQGVSSKAISRRMQTDRGGHQNAKSGREHDRDGDDRSRWQQSEDRDDRRDNDRRDKPNGNNRVTTSTPSAMPSFSMPGMNGFPGFPGGIPGFPMPTLPNGMPMFPPPTSFGYPGQAPPQPPPPGRN